MLPQLHHTLQLTHVTPDGIELELCLMKREVYPPHLFPGPTEEPQALEKRKRSAEKRACDGMSQEWEELPGMIISEPKEG